jgi:murein tripeptide amidase MpaA
MTSGAIESCLVWLNGTYPSFTQLIQLPELSADQRLVVRALRIRAGEGDRNGVLLIGGTHARELINPDLLASLALKLCWAYANKVGLSFGGKTWSATEIRLVVDGMDIFIVPNINPDGRNYVQSPIGYQWWRKNRGHNSDGSRGADLNRNYDFLWQWTIGNTSSTPSADTYRGDAVFSEPETRNVRWLFETYPQITCFVDVHSYLELILHPWGDDNNQNTDASQNFLNPAWDGLRGASGSGYAEYMPATDRTKFSDRGVKIRDAIAAVRGRTYTVEQSFDLYGTSGGSSDYSYSRYYRLGRKRKVWGYVIETNFPGPDPLHPDSQYGFQPPYADALQVMEEVQSGLIQFMLSCLCVPRELGRGKLSVSVLNAVRAFRDREMVEGRRGRRWVELLETHGDELLSLLERDRQARATAEEVTVAGAEIVLALERDEPATIDSALATKIERLAARLEKRATPGLAKELAKVRREARSVVGKTARQAVR